MKILITSGGTKIPIDSVRHIGNMSSGTAGCNIAEAFCNSLTGTLHEVGFLCAKDSKHPIRTTKGIWDVRYFITYDDYVTQLTKFLLDFKPDLVLSAAAVSDYGIDSINDQKVQGNHKISSNDKITITLKPLPKVLDTIKQILPTTKVVGFKLLVDSTKAEMATLAQKQITLSNVDMVLANDLSQIRQGNRSYSIYTLNGLYTRVFQDYQTDMWRDLVDVLELYFEK